jgi:hypothetical protein
VKVTQLPGTYAYTKGGDDCKWQLTNQNYTDEGVKSNLNSGTPSVLFQRV